MPTPCMMDPSAVLSPGWFEEDRITALKEQFGAAHPYTHVVLPELCSRSVLLKARSEIIGNVVAKYKETDLFKVRAPMLWCLLQCTCESNMPRTDVSGRPPAPCRFTRLEI